MPEDAPKKPTLEERLAAAQERRKAAAKAADDALAIREVEAEEKAAELEEKHGASKVAKVATDAGPFVLLRPPGLAWDTWQRAVTKAGKNDIPQKDIDRFIHPAIEFPLDFKQILEDQPATQATLVVALSRLYGAKAAEDLGK